MEKQKSFQVYLWGGRRLTGAALSVVGIGAVVMIIAIFVALDPARNLPIQWLPYLKPGAIVLGVVVIGLGFGVMKLVGTPITVRESRQPNQSADRMPGNAHRKVDGEEARHRSP